MKISTEVGSIAKYVGFERSVDLVAKSGFNAWDFTLTDIANWDYSTNSMVKKPNELNGPNAVAFARKLKQIGLDNGIVCNQTHAPFPTCDVMYDNIKLAIELTAEAGGEICIIHPHSFWSAEKNGEYYKSILPFAKAHGVKIATENMWAWDRETDRASFAACATAKDFVDHLNAVNDDYFVACLDIGHAEMMGDSASAQDMIRKIGSKLKALHLHDNDRWHDEHKLIGEGIIDYKPILQALKDVNYSGYFTLESCYYINDSNASNIEECVKNLANSAKKLVSDFNALK